MSLFTSLSHILPTSSEYSLRSLATCLQAIDPSCTYRTVRARLKSPVYTKALTVCGNDCGFSTDMLATLVTVCLAKLNEDAKRDALAEALNLSRPNNEVTDKADAKVVTAIANNNAAIMRAKATLDNATKAVKPLYLEDGHEDATEEERAVNDATNPMTVAIKTAAAYGEDITKAVEFKPYTFESKLGSVNVISYLNGSELENEWLDGDDVRKVLAEAAGLPIDHVAMSGVPHRLVGIRLLNVVHEVFSYQTPADEAKALAIYKDALVIAWQCVYSDDIDRLTFGQAQSLASQVLSRFDDATHETILQASRNAVAFFKQLQSGAKVIPADSVECICELNAAQARINDRRAKEAAASSQAEAVTEEANEQTAQTAPIAAAATEAATDATTKASLKTAAEASVLCVDVESDDDSTNTPAEPMGFVYEPAKGICEFDRLDVYGNPVTPQDGFNQGLDVPSTDIHTA